MKYTGRLREPITRRAMGLLEDDEAHQAESKRITDEMFSKLPDLFQSHGVPDGDWRALVVGMAKAHVPGFNVVTRAGRKIEWSMAEKSAFRVDVDAIVAASDKRLPLTEAIRLARRAETWADKSKLMSAAALKKHYDKADLRFVEVVKAAQLWDLHTESEKKRESFVSTN